MEEGQKHETIPVVLSERGEHKESWVASCNGNNAAWLCVCGYRLPLIWNGGGLKHKKRYTICPECKKHYEGLPYKGIPEEIKCGDGAR